MSDNPLDLLDMDNSVQTLLLFDISNLLHRTFYAHKQEDDTTTAGMAHHQALQTLNKYHKMYPGSKAVMTFDRPNWRKKYTESEIAITKKVYKGNRRQNMTESDKIKYAQFKQHLEEFEIMIREHTSIICLAAQQLEADDLMAGVIWKYGNNPKYKIVVVSQDRDITQMLQYDNVTQIDPATGDELTLGEYNDDHKYFMYQKCFRGDSGDHVQSAYPRIRTTRIQKAFDDPYEHEQIMNETWIDKDKNEFTVRDLFIENTLLMDLHSQPENIKKVIRETVDEGFENPGKFSLFHFLKFCGRYELKNISKHVERYYNLLGC